MTGEQTQHPLVLLARASVSVAGKGPLSQVVISLTAGAHSMGTCMDPHLCSVCHYSCPQIRIFRFILLPDLESKHEAFLTAIGQSSLILAKLDFTSLALLFILTGLVVSFFVRYRYLSTYCKHREWFHELVLNGDSVATLREVPLLKPALEPLHPDVQGHEAREPFHNYLDEFLLAIRVFGFLEKPVCVLRSPRTTLLSRKLIPKLPTCPQVFHELARHLQTRRLIAGDTLSLHQDKNFYCVIDGLVQVFAKTGDKDNDASTTWEDEDLNGYQLLNEVGSGGTVSSLFTILSLFTENVHLTWPEEASDQNNLEDPDHDHDFLSRSRTNSDVSNLELNGDERPGRTFRRTSLSSSSASTVHAPPNIPLPISSPYSVSRSESRQSTRSDASSQVSYATWKAGGPQSRRGKTTLPSGLETAGGSVARATVDTTLAVIPAGVHGRAMVVET